jgi:hypothetical protein
MGGRWVLSGPSQVLSIPFAEVRPHGAIMNSVAVRIEASFVSARHLTGSCALFHCLGYGGFQYELPLLH